MDLLLQQIEATCMPVGGFEFIIDTSGEPYAVTPECSRCADAARVALAKLNYGPYDPQIWSHVTAYVMVHPDRTIRTETSVHDDDGLGAYMVNKWLQ